MPRSVTVEQACAGNDGRVLRAGCVRHAACIAAPPVIGNSRRNSPISCAPASPAKRSSSDAGSRAWSTGGIKAAAATRQNGLAVNALRHHCRHRAMVLWLTPNSSDSCRAAAAPCRIAETSTTTAPRKTLRPRNRNDGGVRRLRQRSAAQQKLKRWSKPALSPAGAPRGLRRNRAECSTPPQRAHPAARAAVARSRSKANRSSWNLASASSSRYKQCRPFA